MGVLFCMLSTKKIYHKVLICNNNISSLKGEKKIGKVFSNKIMCREIKIDLEQVSDKGTKHPKRKFDFVNGTSHSN